MAIQLIVHEQYFPALFAILVGFQFFTMKRLLYSMMTLTVKALVNSRQCETIFHSMLFNFQTLRDFR